MLFVVGNKCIMKERKVSYEEGHAYATSIDAYFIETSAKIEENIKLVLYTMISSIYQTDSN